MNILCRCLQDAWAAENWYVNSIGLKQVVSTISHLPWDFDVLPWYRGIYLKTVRLTAKPWDLAGLLR